MMFYRKASPVQVPKIHNQITSIVAYTAAETRCLDMAGLAYTDKANGFPGGLVSIFLQVLPSGLSV